MNAVSLPTAAPLPSVVSKMSTFQTTIIENIDPDTARRYLATNNNRRVRQYHVEQLSTDMREGRWRLTHQGIAFDAMGHLVDGQHRLYAIIASGCTVRMSVTRNMSAHSLDAIDIVDIRTPADYEHLSGRPRARQFFPGLRGMFLTSTGIGHGKLSSTKLIELAQKYGGAVDFAIASFGPEKCLSGIKCGPVIGVIARAYCGSSSVDRLKEFGRILSTGVPNGPDDISALAFRNWRISKGHVNAVEVYKKAERALTAFLDRAPLNKVYEATEELFPI